MDDELRLLQYELAQVDLFFPLSKRPANDLNRIELTLARLQNLKLKMYKEKKHSTPHIHIDYGREPHFASFQIDPPRLLAGNLDRAHTAKIVEWLTPRTELLKQTWMTLQSGQSVADFIIELREDD
ncbi:MAG: DUF4160 domain-containing protein [Vicinamibacterales bacterium]